LNLKPTRNRVIIKPIEQNTLGKIILAEESKDKPTTGTVVAVGKDDLGSNLNINDIIMFGKYTGIPVKVKNENYIIIEYKDIIAVIEK